MISRRNIDMLRHVSMPTPGSSSGLLFQNKYSESFFKQCLICLWKQNLSYWRNVHYNGGRYFFAGMIALLFGTAFWNLGMRRWAFQLHSKNISSFNCSLQIVQCTLHLAELKSKISLTRWVQCMLQSSCSAYRMQQVFIQWLPWKGYYSTRREQLECIQLYPTHLHK